MQEHPKTSMLTLQNNVADCDKRGELDSLVAMVDGKMLQHSSVTSEVINEIAAEKKASALASASAGPTVDMNALKGLFSDVEKMRGRDLRLQEAALRH